MQVEQVLFTAADCNQAYLRVMEGKLFMIQGKRVLIEPVIPGGHYGPVTEQNREIIVEEIIRATMIELSRMRLGIEVTNEVAKGPTATRDTGYVHDPGAAVIQTA